MFLPTVLHNYVALEVNRMKGKPQSPAAKAQERRDIPYDKKQGVTENSKKDNALDKKGK